jgi:hypothetical protein
LRTKSGPYFASSVCWTYFVVLDGAEVGHPAQHDLAPPLGRLGAIER